MGILVGHFQPFLSRDAQLLPDRAHSGPQVAGWCFTLLCVLDVSTAETSPDLVPQIPCDGWQGHHLVAWVPKVSVILNQGPQPIPCSLAFLAPSSQHSA